MMLKTLIVLVALPVVALCVDCERVKDGIYETGCRYYVKCEKGKKTEVHCGFGDAFNKKKGKCESLSKVPAPCGTHVVAERERFSNITRITTTITSKTTGLNSSASTPQSSILILMWILLTLLCISSASKVPSPCGTQGGVKRRDCSALKDGSYADTKFNCRYYYTCANGEFITYNGCPGELVFNNDKQACDYRRDTKPPCGKKAGGKDDDDEEDDDDN